MNGMCPICEEYDDQIFYRKVNIMKIFKTILYIKLMGLMNIGSLNISDKKHKRIRKKIDKS